MDSHQMTGAILAIFDEPLPTAEKGGARKSQWSPSNRQPNPHRYLWVSALVSVLQTEDEGSHYYTGRDFRWVARNAGVDPDFLQERILAGELPAIRDRIRWARVTGAADGPRRSLLSKQAAQSPTRAQAAA